MASVAPGIVGFEAPPSGGPSSSPDGGDAGLPEDSPAVLACIVIGVLAAIGLLFTFALLIDCRNQEAEAAKRRSTAERVAKLRRRNFRLPMFFRGRRANGDSLAFASQVCEANRETNPVMVHIHDATPSTSSVPC